MNVIVIGFLFVLMLLMALACINAEKILDRLSEPPKERHEERHERKKGIFEQWKDSKYETGTKKIQEFRERMETFKYMANDSESVRLADGFLEWIDAINDEFCEERTKLQLEVEALKESAKSLEQKYNEANVEAMKIRVDSDQKLREAQERGNEWKRKYLKAEKTKDPLYEDGLLFCDGRDADGTLMRGMDAATSVVVQLQSDESKRLGEQLDKQAKELAELKEELDFEKAVIKNSHMEKYVVHAWKGDTLWKTWRYAPSEEALYEQLHRDGYYRIDYTRKIEGVG